jgi:hypothetical protein
VALLGVVIYSADERTYKEGNYVEMFKEINTSPSVANLTLILHSDKFTEKDALEWRDLISYRLVIITEKTPKLTDKSSDFVIVDESLAKDKEDHIRAIQCVFRVRDRNFVYQQIQSVPVPLLLSFVGVNRPDDINLHRLLNECKYEVADKYIYAVVAYAIKPSGKRVVWPKKKSKVELPPKPFRSNDLYWREIIDNSAEVRNEVREGGDSVKNLKKTKEKVVGWV